MIILILRWHLPLDLRSREGKMFHSKYCFLPQDTDQGEEETESLQGVISPALLRFESHFGCILSFILCMFVFCLHVYMCTMCVPGACRSQKSTGSPNIRVMNGCETLCGCWELTPGLLQEQQSLLSAESSL